MPTWRGTIDSNWNTAGNWSTPAAVPTSSTDAIFDASSPACTVNTATAACRNLNFSGYANTINMANTITVGAGNTSLTNQAVTLSASMTITGSGGIIIRQNGITTLTSNGKVWPNNLSLSTITVTTTSTITLVDNWTVGSLTIGNNSTSVITFSAAFTLTTNGNFTVQLTGSGRLQATAAAIATIKMAGTGTYSCSSLFTGFGLNLTINAPGQTVTLGSNACYGGSGVVTGSTFSYVAGTVTCTDTFYLYFTPSGTATYTLSLSGSSSPSATTTSTTGVNFNNLNFRTSGTTSSQTCTISGNICVVGTLSSNWVTISKAPFLTSGGTIYANGDMTHDATMKVASNTILVLQGTGTWTETTISLATNWGITWQIQINSTGTRTITGTVGLYNTGSLTYTAGTVVFTAGAILYTNASSIYGFGSAGIVIPYIRHVTTSSGSSSIINLYDTVAFQILTVELVGANTNLTWVYGGTIGWICDTFSCSLNSLNTSTSIKLAASIEYTVRTSVSLLAYQPSNGFSLTADTGTPIFTVKPGASEDLYYVNGGGGGGHINSSNGQIVYTRSGTISGSTLNWRQWDFPKTRFSSFISN